MKKFVLLFVSLILCQTSFSGEVFKIEIGKDYTSYSDSDLKRRVWELERAVFQLQQKVFEMQTGNSGSAAATWLCKMEGLGEKFSAVGGSRAVAADAVLEKCKASPKSANGFHCGEVQCSQ
ncbi:MAG: hypothetical protein WC635_11635 [Bacteriovorax sp.]|jgi:hypothetical protein